MTQEEKQLLLKDLSARLPYKVIGKYSWKGRKPYDKELTGNLYDELKSSWDSTEDSKFLPYLRPMESMTTEEICKIENIIGGGFTYRDGTLTVNTEEIIRLPIYKISNLIQFIYSRHLDLNNLIPMGLALEAPEGMYR